MPVEKGSKATSGRNTRLNNTMGDSNAPVNDNAADVGEPILRCH